ncbi:MAG: hypothetical protein JEZ01_06180 [Labilibaculum sp.]|nr:hypothetical protein [Labilibaculum sp.]MBI9057342.1 hypothetical protein [Labilibaculum sp.]
MNKFIVGILFAVLGFACTQLKVGDPGVRFNEKLIEENKENWPQMKIWKTAGVRGGIPKIDKLKIDLILESGSNSKEINTAINQLSSKGGGILFLKNGSYNIDRQVDLKSNVILLGESRKGVTCKIHKDIDANNKGINENIPGARDDGNGAFKFGKGVHNSGIYRLTIEGGWGKPKYDWNVGSKAKNNELPDNENISVWFFEAYDCWIDDLDILNSADFPVRCIGEHITMRNLFVDGVFNKCGGCHGYFFLLNDSKYNLVTACKITHLRHISIQGSGVEYNVVYDNDFEQELSFHTGDDGNNLIENNRIVLPEDMPNSGPNYFAIMGPWASFHHISSNPNFLYRNKCVERNHNNTTPWSDESVVYHGPVEVKPKDHWTNFPELPESLVPVGGTLYPVEL